MDEMNNTSLPEEIHPEEENSPKKEYTRMECIFAVLSLIFGFIFIRYMVFYAAGFAASALYIAIITAVTVFLRKNGCRFTKLNIATAVVLYLFSLVFSITDNGLIKLLDAVFLLAVGAYYVYSTSQEKDSVERFLPFAAMKAAVELPFMSFSDEVEAVESIARNSRTAGNLKMIAAGLAVTVPLTAIVASLLMSADDGVKNMLENILGFFSSESLVSLIAQVFFAVPCACYLFGMIYSNTHKEMLTPINNADCETKLRNVGVVQNIVLYTAVTPICILYMMFFISQANYLLSAFSGSLPEGYFYSEYARKGFFELCAIAVINLAVIIAINLLAKKGGRFKPSALKLYSLILCIFTVLMIAVAVSKMTMYISVYGLTRLRVYTMWFMALLTLFFVLIAIKIFRFDFKISSWSAAVFTVMFGILCFARPDAIIADYNIKMYNSGKIEELDKNALLELSDDAVAAALEKGVISADEAEESRERRMKRKDSYISYNISTALTESFID